VYEGLVHGADVALIATPIRWGNASSLYSNRQSERGFVFPPFPFIAHARGWDAEDMQNNVRQVKMGDSEREMRHALNAPGRITSQLRTSTGDLMRRHLTCCVLLALAVGAPPALSAQGTGDTSQARKEVRRDRRELRGDRRDIRHDTRDIRQDRRDVRQDVRAGDLTDARRDRRDLRQDRRDRRHDVRDARRDRRDLIQDHKRDSTAH
jgi:hypothetical protein